MADHDDMFAEGDAPVEGFEMFEEIVATAGHGEGAGRFERDTLTIGERGVW